MEKMIYYNGTIVCVDKNNTIYEAMLIEDGLIKELGSNDDILKKKQEANIVDLEGRTNATRFY